MSIRVSNISVKTGNPYLATLLIILFVVVVLLFIAGPIYLRIKLFCFLFAISMRELGINIHLGVALYILGFCCCWIHIPLYMVMSLKSTELKFYELYPLWLIKKNSPSYGKTFQPHLCVAINLGGALVPIAIALYQFSRNSPTSILIVTAITASASYLFATIIPGIGICLKWHQFWIVAILSALSALQVLSEAEGSAASIAFAGSVLGTLIGADLLHLKEAQKKLLGEVLSIGGAGLRDGIIRCGLASLLLAECISYGINLFKLIPNSLFGYVAS
ncbi:DUF1614 domain-containing protein [Vacuolonema iberomarrocanum]|uniref:DUF1614 domain-containing protein n=1 Tax=Vacuolonema iberomarrocanum TaxID=3454632 RepID=UPI003F6E3E6A